MTLRNVNDDHFTPDILIQRLKDNPHLSADLGDVPVHIKPTRQPKRFNILVTNPGGQKGHFKIGGRVFSVGLRFYLAHQCVRLVAHKIRAVDGYTVSEVSTGMPIIGSYPTESKAIEEAKAVLAKTPDAELEMKIRSAVELYGEANTITHEP